MATLCISVTFLDGRFHGKKESEPEWPPSPWRLFQALLASAAGNHLERPDCFRFLEKLPPPTILAPRVDTGQTRTAFVPNNQSDVSLDLQKQRPPKVFTPMLLKDAGWTVHYLWDNVRADQEEAHQAMGYARMLHALGLGIDLVVGNGRMLSTAEAAALKSEYGGECWVPAQFGGQSLRIPVEGSSEDLKQCHETTLNCWNGNIYTPPRKPTVFGEAAYVKQGSASRPIAFFRLLRPGDESQRMAAFDPRDAVRISAWVRGCLCACSRKPGAGFDGDPEEYVAGHVAEGVKDTPARFSYLPLPSIGHEHADGLVRRLIVAEPYGGDGRNARWARRVLQGVRLTDENGRTVAELMSQKADNQLERYSRESCRFRTVTPVILPGFDGLDYAKAEKLFMKAVQQAGFPEDGVVDLHLQKAPFQQHAYHPREYRRAHHFARYSAMHAEVTWRYPIHGPLALGVGRHRGLGLFAPVCRKE